MLHQWANNSDKKRVFIDTVDNGLKCNCTCIACGERLVAKNGGEFKEHHFAHKSGHDCGGYRETILHVWSKEIIEEYKTLSVPSYYGPSNGRLYVHGKEKVFFWPGQKLHFRTSEIEAYESGFKPDIICFTEDGIKLWVEICVTHKCSEEKILMIKREGINCIEVTIPDSVDNKSQLAEFLINSPDPKYKCFMNYPYGDSCINKRKEEYYHALKANCRQVEVADCHICYRDYLQRTYNAILDKYRKDLAIRYEFIYHQPRLMDLANTYPDLILPCASMVKPDDRLDEVALEKIFDKEMEFASEINEIIREYNYGSQWNCPRLYAVSDKNGKEYAFCKKDDEEDVI